MVVLMEALACIEKGIFNMSFTDLLEALETNSV